jgi:hypothetical protein
VGEPGKAFQLRSGDPAQVQGPLGALGQADDDESQPVLARLTVLLDEATLLER